MEGNYLSSERMTWLGCLMLVTPELSSPWQGEMLDVLWNETKNNTILVVEIKSGIQIYVKNFHSQFKKCAKIAIFSFSWGHYFRHQKSMCKDICALRAILTYQWDWKIHHNPTFNVRILLTPFWWVASSNIWCSICLCLSDFCINICQLKEKKII